MVAALASLLVAAGGCTRWSANDVRSGDAGSSWDADPSSDGRAAAPVVVRIADQYGLAYAPLGLMRARGDLERPIQAVRRPESGAAAGTTIAAGAGPADGEVRVEWITTGNAAAIREGMLAGRIDVGFMGIPPYLIGVDRGMQWRVFTGLSRVPMALVSNRSGVHTLRELYAMPTARIAVPQPGSIQHILIAMAAERDLGAAAAFDERLVTMAHPDAAAALLAGASAPRAEVAAYMAPPPFLQTVLADARVTPILDAESAFGGPFTFIIGVASARFAEDHPELLDLIRARIEEAAAALRADRRHVSRLPRSTV